MESYLNNGWWKLVLLVALMALPGCAVTYKQKLNPGTVTCGSADVLLINLTTDGWAEITEDSVLFYDASGALRAKHWTLEGETCVFTPEDQQLPAARFQVAQVDT
jgi:hypothetical protein